MSERERRQGYYGGKGFDPVRRWTLRYLRPATHGQRKPAAIIGILSYDWITRYYARNSVAAWAAYRIAIASVSITAAFFFFFYFLGTFFRH